MIAWLPAVVSVLGAVTSAYSDEMANALVSLIVDHPKIGVGAVFAYGTLTSLLNSPLSKQFAARADGATRKDG